MFQNILDNISNNWNSFLNWSTASFVNPWSMLAGLLLISSPIIIHLINRMRFKRIHWAAMEFILKAQKKMKRKMIIEQLILLMLRILLMILIGLLIARFMPNDLSGDENRSTYHLVIIDDSPSMGDSWKDDKGIPVTGFDEAKRVVTDQIAKAASEATTPQKMEIVMMSDPANSSIIEQLTRDNASGAVTEKIKNSTVVTVRTSPYQALLNAKETLGNVSGTSTARVLHVLSDFRAKDWSDNGPAIKDLVEELKKGGVNVHFIDTVHPYRKASTASLIYHENIGILDLKPSKSIVAKYEPVEFTLTVRNYGTQDLKNVRLSVRINGNERTAMSVTFPDLPANEEKGRTERFTLTFDRAGSPENIFEGKFPETALTEEDKKIASTVLQRFNIVSAVLPADQEASGLKFDNERHAVVEVRERLPILVVDGEPALRDKPEGNSVYIQRVFESYGGYHKWTDGTVADLESQDLSKYSLILMLNVPGLSDKGSRALDAFCHNGGGVMFFMGDQVIPKDYNDRLYRDGEGLFPVPLPERPTADLTEEQEKERNNMFQKRFLVRDKNTIYHPALAGIYIDDRGQPNKKQSEAVELFYYWIKVGKYWPVKRQGKWREDKSVSELYCLPKETSTGEYDKKIDELAESFPVDDADLSKYRELMVKYRDELKKQARGGTLVNTVNLLERICSDQITEADAEEALLREMWSIGKMKDIKPNFVALREQLKYGDPIYLTKNHGRGRVTVFLTNLKESWSNFGSSKMFPPIMKEMVSYLSSGGAYDSKTTGSVIDISLPPEDYDTKVIYGSIIYKVKTNTNEEAQEADPAPIKFSEKFETLTSSDGMLKAITKNTKQPGIYIFGFEQKRANPMKPMEKVSVPEFRAVPVNVDTAESDMRRATTDDVKQFTQSGFFHNSGDSDWVDQLKNRKTDWSELGWIFMILFVVLILEQAMAVRLSYHTGNDSIQAHAPSIAAAMRLGPTGNTPAV